MTLSSPVENDLRVLDTRHHLHPFTDTRALAAEGGARVITRGEGVWLWDADGNRMLDGMAGLWNVNIGYGREELADAAYRQMRELAYYNTFFKTTTPPVAALSAKLAELTQPGLDHVFFAGSGSEANDTMVRLVRHFWNLEGAHRKKTIVSRNYAYHGSTMAATSLSGLAVMHRQADLPLPGFVHIMPPYAYDYARTGESDQVFAERAAQALEERIAELGADSVAAFVAEPIQGAGAVIVPPEGYWDEIQRICAKHDVLLVADEVICGFGRTGAWFASDLYGIKPDLMTLGKAITSGYQPMAALMVGDRVASTLIDKGEEFYHGFTYSGHPVPAAVALANIEVMEREGLVARVAEDIGPYLQQRLRETFTDHPLVGEVRGVGMLAAMELVEDKATRRHFPKPGDVGTLCRDHSFRCNLVMRAVRDVMVLSPPLVISRDEVDELIDRASQAIDATARDLGRM
jgi:putrescine aminotransferase